MAGFLSIPVALLLGAYVSSVSALPNVTVVPLTRGCVDYPGWINTHDIDITGGIRIQVDQADDVGVNGLYTTSIIINGTSGTSENIVVDLRKSLAITKPLYRCVNGIFQSLTSREITTIYVQPESWNAQLAFRKDGLKVLPHTHKIAGVSQPGVFLGAQGSTTWGFRYVRPEACGQLDYYEVRLLGVPDGGEPKASYPVEFTGFLRVVESG